MRKFYGIAWVYGANIREGVENGKLLANVYSFDSETQRNIWVSNGPDYRTEAGYREAIKAKRINKYTSAVIPWKE